jgi:hypothetical protein
MKAAAKAGEKVFVTSGDEEFVFQAVHKKSWQGALKGKGRIVGDLFSTDLDWEASSFGAQGHVLTMTHKWWGLRKCSIQAFAGATGGKGARKLEWLVAEMKLPLNGQVENPDGSGFTWVEFLRAHVRHA